jgi:hypothetical protein
MESSFNIVDWKNVKKAFFWRFPQWNLVVQGIQLTLHLNETLIRRKTDIIEQEAERKASVWKKTWDCSNKVEKPSSFFGWRFFYGKYGWHKDLEN